MGENIESRKSDKTDLQFRLAPGKLSSRALKTLDYLVTFEFYLLGSDYFYLLASFWCSSGHTFFFVKKIDESSILKKLHFRQLYFVSSIFSSILKKLTKVIIWAPKAPKSYCRGNISAAGASKLNQTNYGRHKRPKM